MNMVQIIKRIENRDIVVRIYKHQSTVENRYIGH